MKEEQLDDIDRRILRALSRDARISNQKLAESVSLSPTPCWNRVRALENSGVIAEYVTILDQTSLGFPDTVIIEVTLDRHDDEIFQRFGESLACLPEVMEAYLVTGDYDYMGRRIFKKVETTVTDPETGESTTSVILNHRHTHRPCRYPGASRPPALLCIWQAICAPSCNTKQAAASHVQRPGMAGCSAKVFSVLFTAVTPI